MKKPEGKEGQVELCYAPYNFVALNRTVWMPNEADVKASSQDIPRADGLCGHLDLELLADGPLLVGGVQKMEKQTVTTFEKGEKGQPISVQRLADIKNVYFFQTPDEKYAIPGSAVRGMLRNVLKILMLGKFNQVDDARPSQRVGRGKKMEKLSLHEAIRNSSRQHLDEAADRVDLLFGRVLPEQAGAQAWAGKGRVDFSLARLQNPEQAEEQAWRILPGTPKPSYYPHYVEQDRNNVNNGKAALKSLLDENARLRGWKRYQVKQFDEAMLREIEGKIKKLDVKQQQEQSCTLHFIKPKAQQVLRFTLRMRFHNLSPFELGALIWALRWGGDDSCYHSLGMGKPYGAGAVQLKILGQCWRENAKLEQGWQSSDKGWMQTFEQEMQVCWSEDCSPLPSLRALARKKRNLPQYRYMRLEMGGVNDFQKAKKEGKWLPYPQPTNKPDK